MSKAQELKKLREKNGVYLEFRDFEISDNPTTLESYYENILTMEEIEKSMYEYRGTMDRISKEFSEKTKLQGYDLGFLMFATMLQCFRIYGINKLTEIEKANSSGGKEESLHNLQEKIFGKIDGDSETKLAKYYATTEHILTNRGVPYDATNYQEVNYGLFKGGNHRFSTLGHDPMLGLVFGTANILTNSITCFKTPILTTNHVVYDTLGKNPRIGTPDSTMLMLRFAIGRFENDKSAVAAAVIKQLIHIATDLYTPCGIQLPGASLVLSTKHVEELTKYISTGDVIKVGASAGLSAMIKWIISAIHGCKLLFEDDGEDFSKELYSIRTRKIILYSNLIASSSNVIATGLSGNIKEFDLGGFIVTCYRLFNDTKFIEQIKYEFLNSQVSEVYEEKIKDLDMYYS